LDVIPPGRDDGDGDGDGEAVAPLRSFFQAVGKVVRPSSVVQGEEFQSLLSSMDNRISNLESKSEDFDTVTKALSAEIDALKARFPK